MRMTLPPPRCTSFCRPSLRRGIRSGSRRPSLTIRRAAGRRPQVCSHCFPTTAHRHRRHYGSWSPCIDQRDEGEADLEPATTIDLVPCPSHPQSQPLHWVEALAWHADDQPAEAHRVSPTQLGASEVGEAHVHSLSLSRFDGVTPRQDGASQASPGRHRCYPETPLASHHPSALHGQRRGTAFPHHRRFVDLPRRESDPTAVVARPPPEHVGGKGAEEARVGGVGFDPPPVDIDVAVVVETSVVVESKGSPYPPRR